MTTGRGMSPRHHVLLVGIDAYTGANPLNGCVNDIDAIQRVLVGKLGVDLARIKRLAAPRGSAQHETVVPEDRPTLANLRQALADLASEVVAPGEPVFIYYSGHGTQIRVTAPDGSSVVREALLPFDHVVYDERRYLFDWELNNLLGRIAQRTQSITCILDCCCSAGATRSMIDADPARGSLARFWPSREPYVSSAAELREARLGPRGVARGLASGVETCQVIAACLDDERARESTREGTLAHGELTRAFSEQLASVSDDELADLRWGRIWRAILARLEVLNPAQHPWISGSFARLVFGGPPERGDVGLALTQVGDIYHIDAGTLSDVTEGAEIAVYRSTPFELPPVGSDADLAERAGLLRVTSAARASSEAVAVTAASPWPAGARGRLVLAGRDAKLAVGLSPPDDELAARIAASPLLRVAAAGEPVAVTLMRRADQSWAVTDDVFGAGDVADEPLLVLVPPPAADHVRPVLEHYHRYSAPLRMAKRSNDLGGFLRIVALDCNDLRSMTAEQAQDPDLREVSPGVRAAYELRAKDGTVPGDKVCFRIESQADVPLRVTLIDCQASGKVAILGEKKLPEHGKHVFWCGENLGTPFEADLPPGQSLGVDRVVLIGTTRLEASLRYLEVNHGFAELFERTRGARGTVRGQSPEQWTSAVTVLRMERKHPSSPARSPTGR